MAERLFDVNGSKTIVIKLPLCNGGKIVLTGAQFELKIYPLKTYNISFPAHTDDFINLASNISLQMKGFQPKSKLITSEYGYKIVVLPDIMLYSGVNANTPCMIGSKTGIIEASERFMTKMSINERVAAFCHEWGHFYGNPASGVPVENENGADINGMLLFLSFGFGQSDYVQSFRKTFKENDNSMNRHREMVMRKIAKDVQDGKIYKPIYEEYANTSKA
jgi:hypothetical protein